MQEENRARSYQRGEKPGQEWRRGRGDDLHASVNPRKNMSPGDQSYFREHKKIEKDNMVKSVRDFGLQGGLA